MFSSSKSLFRSPTGGGPGPADPSFAYVPLLLNTTSTNGQQNNTFLDSSTNNFTITRNGTPTQGSVTPYWPDGYWGIYNEGASNYLSVPYNVALNLVSGDFTIETWFYCTALTASLQQIINKDGVFGTSYSQYEIAISSSGTLVAALGNGNGVVPAQTDYGVSTSVPLNVWNHVALVRTGTTIKVFFNGSQVNSASQVTAMSDGGKNLLIGYQSGQASSFYFNGYISNTRIVKGTAVYTASFTPSTTPLTSITNTSLLTCQSNRFKDNSTNNFALTVTGTPKIQAFQPFSPTASYTAALYGGSGYFNGTSDYLTLTNSTALNPGTGAFTFECWAYATSSTLTSINATPSFLECKSGGLAVVINQSGQLAIAQSFTSYLINDTVAFPAFQWVHIVAVRSGTNLSLYKNGIRVATSASNSTNFVADELNYIGNSGAFSSSNFFWPGYISNMRLVIGTAVYNPTLTTLTVSTAPVTAVANTKLLTNFTNAGIYDAAVQNNLITVGDAQVSTTITAQWPPTSMKFDGTGDWLTAIDNPQLQLGTGDFTIDGWVYLSATGVAYGIISKGTASTGWSVNVTSGNKLQFSYTSSNLTGATSLAATTWYYFAVVRSGSATGNLKVYLNGSVDATSGGAVTDNFNQTSILYVGANRTGGSALNGYLQDVRVTKYARTITTPTAAFPTR